MLTETLVQDTFSLLTVFASMETGDMGEDEGLTLIQGILDDGADVTGIILMLSSLSVGMMSHIAESEGVPLMRKMQELCAPRMR